MEKEVTILIPTYNRSELLAVMLTSLIYQTYKNFDISISNQSDEGVLESDYALQAVIRVLSLHGHTVSIKQNLPRQGMAQQRQFLLSHVQTPYALFLDDDLLLEDYVVQNMVDVIQKQQIGFVGNAVIGLSFLNDIRPHQQSIEFWTPKVLPETIRPHSPAWQRYLLHNAANIYHVQQRYNITSSNPKLYKVAWIGGCTLYDTAKLRDCGGFEFYKSLPINHCGEDVAAQLAVMKKYGGCGIIPSGVYHQEAPTTITNRQINVPEYVTAV